MARCTRYEDIEFFTKIHEDATQEDGRSPIRTRTRTDWKIFARKILRIFGSVTEQDIENEARAISELCRPGQSRCVVEVIKHGWMHKRDAYFLDMEYCPMTLADKIRGTDTRTREQTDPAAPTAGKRDNALPGPSYTNHVLRQQALPEQVSDSINFDFESVSQILEDIVAGLIYIHAKNFVHRDLKPRNGILIHARFC
jgi:serine/threonine protein kinase